MLRTRELFDSMASKPTLSSDNLANVIEALQVMPLSLIPNSRLVLLNRCGHWAMIEHPDEFNRLVADFVANN